MSPNVFSRSNSRTQKSLISLTIIIRSDQKRGVGRVTQTVNSSPALSRELQFGETWAVWSAPGRSLPASPLHYTTLAAASIIFIFFFPEQGHPVRLLLLLQTNSRRIKKREESSNNAPRSSQPRENFTRPLKPLSGARLAQGPPWHRLPGCVTPAVGPRSSNFPGWEVNHSSGFEPRDSRLRRGLLPWLARASARRFVAHLY